MTGARRGLFREGPRLQARAGQAALTALLAVLHAVAIQASGSLALRGPPLEGHGGVGDVLHRQVGGLAGGAWAGEGRAGPESHGANPAAAFEHFKGHFSSVQRPVSR